MENASKAIIIAGAILIAIVLISIGIIIINSTGDLQDNAQSTMGSQAIQTFNSQFTGYEGGGQSASAIKTLISTVNSSNATSANQVKITAGEGYITSGADLSTKNTYRVKLTYGTDGYISEITITKD